MGGEQINDKILKSDICFEVLKILDSFKSGTMTIKDLEYVAFQKQDDPLEDYPQQELKLPWVHYLIFNFHNIKIKNLDFKKRYILPLLQAGFVKIARGEKILKKIITQNPESIDKLDFVIEISPTGASFYKRLDKYRDQENHTLRFDESTGYLYINGLPVKTTKLSKGYNILKFTLNDKSLLKDEVFFSSLKDKIDASDKKLNDKYFLNGFQSLRKKIIEEARVDDLYTLTKQSIRFNPKYLT